MRKKKENYAFIDSQNMHLGVQELDWKVDYKRFRVYLREKYNVSKAYLFFGYIQENAQMYDFLTQCGFTLIFKPVVARHGSVKGNCDAELVLQTMLDYKDYSGAVIVTGDGDYHCLVKHLITKRKLSRLIVPNRYRYSVLLRGINGIRSRITFMNDLQKKLAYKNAPTRKH